MQPAFRGKASHLLTVLSFPYRGLVPKCVWSGATCASTLPLTRPALLTGPGHSDGPVSAACALSHTAAPFTWISTQAGVGLTQSLLQALAPWSPRWL